MFGSLKSVDGNKKQSVVHLKNSIGLRKPLKKRRSPSSSERNSREGYMAAGMVVGELGVSGPEARTMLDVGLLLDGESVSCSRQHVARPYCRDP